MASFDWETNKYPFKLVSKSGANESCLRESLEKCCETCKFYVEDFSTGQSECNGPDGDWVRYESENYWTPAYDYCDKYQAAPVEESKLLVAQCLEADSTLCIRTILEKHLNENGAH
jgi:hypothetical protein